MSDKVDQLIEVSMDRARKSFLHVPWPAKTTLIAWSILKGFRRSEEYKNNPDELVCAEHYMFARWITSVFPLSAPIIGLMAASYQLTKVANLFSTKYLDVNIVPRFGEGPASPPSAQQLSWEMRGIQRGCLEAPMIGPVPNPGFLLSFGQELLSLAKDMGWTR